MPFHLHQEFNRKPGYTVARMAACTYHGKRPQKTLAPVAMARFDGMEASAAIEKDGTGIGTGYDTERRSALGAWSGLAQDVLMEHGRSRTLTAPPRRERDVAPGGLVVC